jgi:tRNA dimethylallyltransferase
VAVSALHRAHKFNDEPFRVLKIGLYMDRKRLYERIEQRVDDMMKAGFVDEVEMLIDRGYTSDLKSMQAIGYRHLVDVIEGRTSLKAALNTLKRDTKRYAKRQITWFKADSEIVWSTTDQTADIRQTIRTFLQIK